MYVVYLYLCQSIRFSWLMVAAEIRSLRAQLSEKDVRLSLLVARYTHGSTHNLNLGYAGRDNKPPCQARKYESYCRPLDRNG